MKQPDVHNESWAVPKEIREARLQICESCDRLGPLNMCKECNCVVILKAKLPKSKCPIGKW
jgi:hypothetical protein